jgi:serine kinase of HPr protein (carbohydrate metabolism regulator)
LEIVQIGFTFTMQLCKSKVQINTAMSILVLKQDVLDRIKEDAVLFGLVAKAVPASPYTLPRLIKENHAKLTQASVLNTIKEYTGIKKDNELLEEAKEVAA